MSLSAASTFGPVIADLLAEDRLAPLGPGRPNSAIKPKLARLTIEQIVAPKPVFDQDMARATLAGLWMYHDFLDESHTISQELATPTGSYWHGLMHRREPDYGNAGYWFRRVGRHPVFDVLGPQSADLAVSLGQQKFLSGSRVWDPFAFIDECEACAGGSSPNEDLCRRVQRLEWDLVFAHCFRAAVGKAE